MSACRPSPRRCSIALRKPRGGAAAFVRYYLRSEEKKLSNLVPPIAGFLICLLLWLNLSRPAKIAGAVWMGVGIAFGLMGF